MRVPICALEMLPLSMLVSLFQNAIPPWYDLRMIFGGGGTIILNWSLFLKVQRHPFARVRLDSLD